MLTTMLTTMPMQEEAAEEPKAERLSGMCFCRLSTYCLTLYDIVWHCMTVLGYAVLLCTLLCIRADPSWSGDVLQRSKQSQQRKRCRKSFFNSAGIWCTLMIINVYYMFVLEDSKQLHFEEFSTRWFRSLGVLWLCCQAAESTEARLEVFKKT